MQLSSNPTNHKQKFLDDQNKKNQSSCTLKASKNKEKKIPLNKQNLKQT